MEKTYRRRKKKLYMNDYRIIQEQRQAVQWIQMTKARKEGQDNRPSLILLLKVNNTFAIYSSHSSPHTGHLK